MAGSAVALKGQINGFGGTLEFWQFTLDPASIAAAAQGIETVAIPGARLGDPCIAQVEAGEASLVPTGAKVTGSNEVSVYITNNITVTTAFDGAALTWTLMIFKKTITPTIP